MSDSVIWFDQARVDVISLTRLFIVRSWYRTTTRLIKIISHCHLPSYYTTASDDLNAIKGLDHVSIVELHISILQYWIVIPFGLRRNVWRILHMVKILKQLHLLQNEIWENGFWEFI